MSTTLDADILKGFEADALNGAKKLCKKNCPAPCTACEKEHQSLGVPAMNPDFKCPLQKFGIKDVEDPRPWYEIPREEVVLSDDEMVALCIHCDKAEKEIKDGYITIDRSNYDKTCLDCPVWMVFEQQAEAEAEASCS